MGIESDLRHAAVWVSEAAERISQPAFSEPYHALRRAAEQLGTAWCGSWLPQFANLYDRDLAALPVGLRLLASGGADHLPSRVRTRCRPWTVQEIRSATFGRAGCSNDWGLQHAALAASATVNEALVSLLAPLECAAAERPRDARLEQLATAAAELAVVDKFALIDAWRPRYSRLRCARAHQFHAPPPHIDVLASLDAMASPFEGLRQIAALMRAAADQLQGTAPPAAPWVTASAAATNFDSARR